MATRTRDNILRDLIAVCDRVIREDREYIDKLRVEIGRKQRAIDNTLARIEQHKDDRRKAEAELAGLVTPAKVNDHD